MSNRKFPYSLKVLSIYTNASLSQKCIINMYNWIKNQISKIYNAVSAPVAISQDALSERLQSVRDTASLLYNRMMDNIRYGQNKLKNIVEKEAKKEHQQTGDYVDLTPMEHERALKEAYKSFVVPGLPKSDVDSYIEKVKQSLIEKQLGEMNSAKVIMTLWVKWKKPLPKPAFTPDAEDLEGAEDIEGTGDQYIRIEMSFNSFMREFFNGRYRISKEPSQRA